MGKALYRKYRSKKLSEVVGQSHITDTLTKALQNKSISHAYLLTGPRGVGKTSVARILAHEVNGLTYGDEGNTHLDIIEIDAASNRRIDEIRELKERVNIAPTSATYKVYIIDEVHMLTKEAFNALLKTLEEPPEHVIFILATTEAHKLPATIISRTQRFSFKPVALKDAVDHLKYISTQEGIKIDDDALRLIAQHGDGSFRDSISLLDQIQHVSKDVKVSDVQNALGLAPPAIIDEIIQAVSAGNKELLIKCLNDTQTAGISATQVAKQLSAELRHNLIDNSVMPEADLISLLSDLANIGSASDPDLALELCLFRALLKHSSEPKTIDIPQHSAKPKGKDPVKEKPEVTQPESLALGSNSPAESTIDQWPVVLEALKDKHTTLYGVVRMAQADIQADKLVLTFNFPFHQKRLQDDKNRKLLTKLIKDTTGKNLVIEAMLNKSASKPGASNTQQDKALQNISNIFGSAEVLE